jgi:hypothetical protein
MDVEIKQNKEQKNKPEIVAKTTKKASVMPSAKHGNAVPKVVIKSAKNNKNIITIIALDEQGNEKGNEFNVTEKEYERSFSNDKKFKFKKKAI